ncbi:hypothetical protein GS966_11240 [Rhodococcus hoagii]|nr:hypothetical protein [Prescottella equi]
MSTLTDAVTESIGKMPWLKDADKGAIALAYAYAKQIDAAVNGEGESSGYEATKALYLGPHLLNALRALGGTPDGRAQLDVTEAVEGALSGIRRKRPAATGG